MYVSRISIVVVAIICASLVSRAQQTNISPANARLLADASKLLSVESEADAVSEKMSQEITKLVQEKNYSKLDQLADRLRKSKEQVGIGTWKLLIFYHVLSYVGPI